MKVNHRRDAIRALRARGLTLGQLARVYGVTRQRIHQLCIGVTPPPKAPIPSMPCAFCGTAFKPKNREQTHCGRVCAQNATAARRRGHAPQTVELKCDHCGKTFTRSHSYQATLIRMRKKWGGYNGLNFCSRSCSTARMRTQR